MRRTIVLTALLVSAVCMSGCAGNKTSQPPDSRPVTAPADGASNTNRSSTNTQPTGIKPPMKNENK